MNKSANNIYKYRLLILLLGLAVTTVAAFYAKDVVFKTIYSEMLPKHDPFIKTHLKYQTQYGGPLSVSMILKVKEGNIIQADILEKIKKMTEELDATPYVNHDQVFSIASRKVRWTKVDEYGSYSVPLLPADKPLPKSVKELEDFDSIIKSTPGLIGVYVSFDKKAAYFKANLIPNEIDYTKVFAHLRKLEKTYTDDKSKVYLFGEPVLTGWVYTNNHGVLKILLLSFLLMLTLLLYLSKNIRLVFLASIASVTSAIWGLGFIGVLGWSMDPLILVIPMLVMARTLSHSVQMGMRYLELYDYGNSKKDNIVLLIKKQFKPGVLGVVTDAAGIFLIAVADFTIMQKLAIFAGVWSLSVIISVLIMMPLLLNYMREPVKFDLTEPAFDRGYTHTLLKGVSYLTESSKNRQVIWGLLLVITVVSLWVSKDLQVGEIEPGSSLLWQDSSYNQAVSLHAKNFVGTDELLVIVEPPPVEGNTKAELNQGVRSIQIMNKMWEFQRQMSSAGYVLGSLSYIDLLPTVKRSLSGNYPKFEVLPITDQELAQNMELMQSSSAPGDFDYFFNRRYKDASIRVFAPDHKAATVRTMVAAAEKTIEKINEDTSLGNGVLRMAAGSIGIAAATNNEVSKAQSLNFILTVLAIIVFLWIGYRSFVAVIILLVPLLLTDVVIAAIMVKLGISINVNTLPILSVGMGIGIDYGIYLLSRAIEENKNPDRPTLNHAVGHAIFTSGRAIFVTAITMVFAVGSWYFMSDLRFQADMGLLLALIMIINCIGALVLIPLFVNTFKPKFFWRHEEVKR
ncbi:RND family transporter [Cycloclasticus sp. P1]|uniref:efflux RND transporter permease subunit n=1 Tax=Cycloclasticus sp. (strain P1) TaxID=385025 RepID=UPI001EE6584F|nr:MMPL family transporter [Cycloclasticus sp. P1]